MPAPLIAASLAIKIALSAPTIFPGNCNPARVHLAGQITSDAVGPVRYTWVRSEKPTNRTFTLQFDKPGSLPVAYDWLLKGPAEGWIVLHVIAPQDVHSEKVRFEVTCKASGR
jgi:hypothetical protein